MKEVRVTEIRATEPSAEGEGALTIAGRPIVFDQVTEIRDAAGSYFEVIRSGALDSADISDCHLFYNHDTNHVPLARTPKTMQLQVSSAGLDMTAQLPDTEEARSVYEAIKRGDLSGMSFAFTVPEGGDTFDPQTNTRTINKIAKVYEVSVVPFPAYAQTSVEARSQMSGALNRKRLVCACNQILVF
jgi:HK97 family phage prohead protease